MWKCSKLCMKRVIRVIPTTPWPQLLLSICGKKIYIVKTYIFIFLAFQLPPWWQLRWLTSTSNLFCPNRIHTFPFPLLPSSSSLPQLSEHLCCPSSCDAKNDGIIPHALLTLTLHTQASYSFSKCCPPLMCQVLGFYLPEILMPTIRLHHAATFLVTAFHSRFLMGVPPSTLASW